MQTSPSEVDNFTLPRHPPVGQTVSMTTTDLTPCQVAHPLRPLVGDWDSIDPSLWVGERIVAAEPDEDGWQDSCEMCGSTVDLWEMWADGIDAMGGCDVSTTCAACLHREQAENVEYAILWVTPEAAEWLRRNFTPEGWRDGT